MYHYAGNNPVKYLDPDGNQMVVPAPIGPVPVPVPVMPFPYPESNGPKPLGDEFIPPHNLGNPGSVFPTYELGNSRTVFPRFSSLTRLKITIFVALALPVFSMFANKTDIPIQGEIGGNPSVDAGKQGKQSLPDMKKNPPDHPDYKPPKNWDGKKVKNPNGAGTGWPAKNGDVWVPEDHKGTHAPHWDVQHKDGSHTPTYPE